MVYHFHPSTVGARPCAPSRPLPWVWYRLQSRAYLRLQTRRFQILLAEGNGGPDVRLTTCVLIYVVVKRMYACRGRIMRYFCFYVRRKTTRGKRSINKNQRGEFDNNTPDNGAPFNYFRADVSCVYYRRDEMGSASFVSSFAHQQTLFNGGWSVREGEYAIRIQHALTYQYWGPSKTVQYRFCTF